jgi:urease beta subunit
MVGFVMDYGELKNQRVLALARAHDCTVEQAHMHLIQIDRDLFLKRTLALELMRLDCPSSEFLRHGAV